MNHAVLAAIAFSLVASSVYIFNDIADREQDQHHHFKKHRPLTAGTVNLKKTMLLGIALGILGLSLGCYISVSMSYILSTYLLLNCAYSYYLKNIIILDVMIIASGFLLRVLAGTTGIGIPPSNWLLLCTLFLTLFLGFSKRSAELKTLSKKPALYSKALLNKLIGINAGGAIISYALYTLHSVFAMLYTVPLAIYGILRYLYLVDTRSNCGLDITLDIFHDWQLLIVIIVWLLSIFLIGV